MCAAMSEITKKVLDNMEESKNIVKDTGPGTVEAKISERPVSRAVEVDRAHQAEREELSEQALKIGALIRGTATCYEGIVPRGTEEEK